MVAPPISDQDGKGTGPEGKNRRAYQRRRCERLHTVRLLARPDLQSFWAMVHDVDPQGLGLVLAHPLDEGAVLAVHLRGARRDGLSCVLSGRVRHCTRWTGGEWLVGCKLSRPLTDEELAALA